MSFLNETDKQYNSLIRNIIMTGLEKPVRNGFTKTKIGQTLDFDLSGKFPIISTKKVAWKHAVRELLWHLGPDSSNINALGPAKHLWQKWADKNGYLSSSYGRMWRKFPMPNNRQPGESWSDNEFVTGNDLDGFTFDQIGWLINELKVNPNSRRLVITSWHPGNATAAVLPPCQPSFTFTVMDNKFLCCIVHARSQDCVLGLPFDIIAYAVLTQIIAKLTNLHPYWLQLNLVDAHIYSVHLEKVMEQIQREPITETWPEMNIKEFKSIEELTLDHFELLDYKSHEPIQYELL